MPRKKREMNERKRYTKMCTPDARGSFTWHTQANILPIAIPDEKRMERKNSSTHKDRANARENERVSVRVYVRERQRLVPLYLFLLKNFYKVNQYRFFGILACSVAPLHRQQMLYVKNPPRTHLHMLAYTQ